MSLFLVRFGLLGIGRSKKGEQVEIVQYRPQPPAIVAYYKRQKMLATKRMKRWAYGGLAAGALILVLTGIIFWAIVPKVIEYMVKQETRLVNTSDTWNKWVNLPVPIHLKFYFFNVTNYEDFVGSRDLSIKPKFKEVGPFAFRETRVKYDIEEGPDDTLFYRQNITYVFDPDKSAEGLTENMRLTVVNIPFVVVITLVDIYPNIRPFAYTVLKNLWNAGETIFQPNVSVREVVFEGVQLKQVYRTILNVAKVIKIPLPDEIFNNTFALYRGKNATNHAGRMQVFRGIKDPSKFSTFKSLDGGRTNLKPWWFGACAMINGSDGSMFPPFVEKTTRLYIYAAEVCRSIFLDYDSESEYEGVAGYRFKLSKDLFTIPAMYKPNWCFCMPVREPLNSSCDTNGIVRVFSCKENFPVAISKPHFLDADPAVVAEAIKLGMNPSADLHDGFLDVEPHTGFPLRLHMRIQVGIEVQPYTSDKLPPFHTLPHAIYPIFWIDETAELDEPLINEIKRKLGTPLTLVKIGKWLMIWIGVLLIVVCGVYIDVNWNKS